MAEVLQECHVGVPMLGGVLNALTTRLDADAIAFMLEQGEAKVSIADREYGEVIKQPFSRF
jgi:fatty-acyl-CoA synthase